MAFKIIDRSTWKREEYFKHFTSNVPCTYSITTHLDITPLIEQKYQLYPAMLFLISAGVNRHEEFRMALNENGDVGIYDSMSPCYTVFHKESETFSNVWTEYSEDFCAFMESYRRDIKEYGAIEQMNAKPNTPKNTFPVSMLPWVSFDGFNLNLQKGYDFLIPIFTMGKFENQNGKIMLPLAVQVHHGVCDGFHVSRLIGELQEDIFRITHVSAQQGESENEKI